MNLFDASALAKRYVREVGSSTVKRLLAQGGAAVSRLSEAEISSALARRRREGALTAAAYTRALRALRHDMEQLHVVELSPVVVAAVHPLLVRHALRAGDALQLACALALREALGSDVTLVVYDRRRHAAGRAEGFEVRPLRRAFRYDARPM